MQKLNAELKLKLKTYVPITRGRRLRTNESIRSLVRETTKSVRFYVSHVYCRGKIVQVEIASMPGIFRRSIDLTVKKVYKKYTL
jgi:porphobilinogen synthase